MYRVIFLRVKKTAQSGGVLLTSSAQPGRKFIFLQVYFRDTSGLGFGPIVLFSNAPILYKIGKIIILSEKCKKITYINCTCPTHCSGRDNVLVAI